MSDSDEIRAKCACKHDDARECLRLRSPISGYLDEDDEGYHADRCECSCHRELAELYGDDD